MERTNLVRMANQITDFFELYPKAEALDGIAKQVHNTWDPRMRDELRNIVEAGGEGLNPLCMEALQDYFLGPNSPGRRATVDPRDPAPQGAQPSFADGGGDAG